MHFHLDKKPSDEVAIAFVGATPIALAILLSPLNAFP